MVLKFIKFQFIYFRWWLHSKFGNFLVTLWLYFTPKRPTDDTLPALIQQELVWVNRKNELIRYNLWMRILELGSEMNVLSEAKQLPPLETEDVLATKKEKNNE